MPTRCALFLFAVGLLFTFGCQPPRLDESKSYKMGPGDANLLALPAISKAQTLKVEFTSSKSEVTVYVAKDVGKDDETPKKEDTLEMKKGKAETFSVEVPANTATRVIVRDAHETTDVTLKVTNSK